MDRHRTRFLASLAARLERDRVLRESEDEEPPIWEEPHPAGEPAPPDFSGAIDRADEAPEADDRAIPAEDPANARRPARRFPSLESLRRREPNRGPVPAVPWSEKGMSPALRDAIASVRRVANHERDEPRTDQVRYEPRAFDDDPADDQGLFDRAETGEPPLFEDHGLREELPSDDPAPAERFEEHALYEEPPLGRGWVGPQQRFDQPARTNAWPAPGPDPVGGRASLDGDAPLEDLRIDDGADAPLRDDAADAWQSFDDRSDEDSPQGLPEAARDRAPLARGSTQRRGLHVAALVLAPLFVLVVGFGFGILSGAQEFDRLLTTIGWPSLAGGHVEAPPGHPARPPTDLAPPATRAAQPPTSNAATASTNSAQSPMSGTAPPAASSAQESAGAGAAPAPSPQLSELETVRVAPLPAPPKTESTPDRTTSDMPLPPPPKPAPWSSLSEEGSGSARVEGAADAAAGTVLAPDGPLDEAVEDATGAGLAADATADDAVEDAAVAVPEADGEGGPFDPILIKTTISKPQVFVHYTKSAAGSTATALNVVRQLRAAGFMVEGRAVAIPIPRDSVRYFFDGDRDEAEAVSARLQDQVTGGAMPIVDFTSYQPKPRQGHLEVWLGG